MVISKTSRRPDTTYQAPGHKSRADWRIKCLVSEKYNQVPTGHGSDSSSSKWMLSSLTSKLSFSLSSKLSFKLSESCFETLHKLFMNQLLFVSFTELLWEFLGISLDASWKLEISSSFLGTKHLFLLLEHYIPRRGGVLETRSPFLGLLLEPKTVFA